MRLPEDDCYISWSTEAKYFISADWLGEHDVVSECGWWRGSICIAQDQLGRFVDWMKTCSIKLEDETVPPR